MRHLADYQELIESLLAQQDRHPALLHLRRHRAGEERADPGRICSPSPRRRRSLRRDRGRAGHSIRISRPSLANASAAAPAIVASPDRRRRMANASCRAALPRPIRSRGLADPDLFPAAAIVGGRRIGLDQRASLAVTDPATGETIGHVPALDAGRRPRRGRCRQRRLSRLVRPAAAGALAPCLRRWFELIVAARDDLAVIMTREQGKPLRRRAARSTTPPPSSSSTPRRPSARTSRASPRISPAPRSRSGASRPASPRW